MKSNGKSNPLLRTAQILSDIFSPLLIPTYAYTMLMWLTPLVLLPERTRFITMAVVALITAVIPTALLLTLRSIGRITTAALPRRSERLLPMAVTTLCYLGAAWYLASLHAPMWVCRFFMGAAAAVIIALVITLRWKISAHATGIAGMTGMVLWLAFRHLLIVQPMLVITVSFLLCGIIGSCRMALLRHTLGQVAAGTALGLTCVIATLLF